MAWRGGGAMEGPSPPPLHTHTPAAAPPPPLVDLTPQLYAAMGVEERTAAVHRHLPPALLQYAEAVLHDAAARFPRSPLMQVGRVGGEQM